MKKILVKISLIVAMGIMLVSQVNAQSTEYRFPFSISFGPCEENVDVEGELHVVFNNVTSNSGNTMSKFHVNVKGSGIGQTSGAVYQ